jgi:hypothetical protein
MSRAWIEGVTALRVLCAPHGEALEEARRSAARADDPDVRAGSLVLADLRERGWSLWVERGDLRLVSPARPFGSQEERAVARAELRAERSRQLREPAVGEFLDRMERSRAHSGRLVSIFDLMREGSQLAAALASGERRSDAAIRPYIQVVEAGARCAHTGLLLGDVWRYFRHTWATPYKSNPGRGMQILVRDAAGPCHPVIGLIMLGSAPSQIAARDAWIGWNPDQLVAACRGAPNDDLARWVDHALRRGLDEVRRDDLIADGSVSPNELLVPSDAVVARLRSIASAARAEHARFASAPDLKGRAESADSDHEGWRGVSEAPLFRAKRCLALAELLQAAAALQPIGQLTAVRLHALANTRKGARALAILARREKASRMGVGIADITVCGALSPYRELLGGKLVSLLAVSAEVRDAWERRYEGAPSIITSSMAGRSVQRSSTLAVLTTTALYGRWCSQYNRVRLPLGELGLGFTGELRYQLLGETDGWGSGQLAADTVEALSRVVSVRRGGARVDSVFGEGVNPRLRKVRDGLSLLGIPADVVLRHGSRRAVYGVELGLDARRWLRGMADDPSICDRGAAPNKVTAAVVGFWERRWLAPRVLRPGVLEAVACHTLHRPVRHGARVAREEDSFGES